MSSRIPLLGFTNQRRGEALVERKEVLDADSDLVPGEGGGHAFPILPLKSWVLQCSMRSLMVICKSPQVTSDAKDYLFGNQGTKAEAARMWSAQSAPQ